MLQFQPTKSCAAMDSIVLPCPPPPTESVIVISKKYCLPFPKNLIILGNLLTQIEGNLKVVDDSGKIIFKVNGNLLSDPHRLVMLDACGQPLVSIQPKIITPHPKWEVFRGNSSSSEDLIFSVKKSSPCHLKSDWVVFLAANTEEIVCDFKIKHLMDGSYDVFIGNSKTIIAKMKKTSIVPCVVVAEKDKFAVNVHPNVDHAFIAALGVILEEMNGDVAN